MDGGYLDVVNRGLVGWAADQEWIEPVVVLRNADGAGLQVLPRRWVAERTVG